MSGTMIDDGPYLEANDETKAFKVLTNHARATYLRRVFPGESDDDL